MSHAAMKAVAFLLILAAAAQAGPRTSASYTIATDTAGPFVCARRAGGVRLRGVG